MTEYIEIADGVYKTTAKTPAEDSADWSEYSKMSDPNKTELAMLRKVINAMPDYIKARDAYVMTNSSAETIEVLLGNNYFEGEAERSMKKSLSDIRKQADADLAEFNKHQAILASIAEGAKSELISTAPADDLVDWLENKNGK